MDYGRDEKNMEQLKNAFLQSINEQLLLVIISSPRKKDGVLLKLLKERNNSALSKGGTHCDTAADLA